jgi:integrase
VDLSSAEQDGDPVIGMPLTLVAARRLAVDILRQRAMVDEAMGIDDWQIRDLRRTFVTGLANLGIRPDVIELAVNHSSGTRGGVAGVYNRSKLLPERKAALERWAAHVIRLVEGRSASVVPMKRA